MYLNITLHQLTFKQNKFAQNHLLSPQSQTYAWLTLVLFWANWTYLKKWRKRTSDLIGEVVVKKILEFISFL